MVANSSNRPLVGIVMGSATDADILRPAKALLEEFGVGADIRVLSAHRSPDEAIEWAKGASDAGFKVLIASAGMAAHLAGVVAANTHLPVLGVPVDGGILGGLDSLLSTVQMPKGTPVGTLAVGKGGAINAALLAIRILALGDPELERKIVDYKKKLCQETLASDKTVRSGAKPFS